MTLAALVNESLARWHVCSSLFLSHTLFLSLSLSHARSPTQTHTFPLQNLAGHNSVVNSLVCNHDGIMVSGADNGTMSFWDYRTGYEFQKTETIVQPGSLDSEAGIFAMSFDRSVPLLSRSLPRTFAPPPHIVCLHSLLACWAS